MDAQPEDGGMTLADRFRAFIAPQLKRRTRAEAQALLARIVETNRNAPATVTYRKHREAALKHTRG